MDNINGIPFISESDSTDSFLSNLLPLSPNPSNINPPDGFTGYKWQYLKRSLDEIQNDFFGFSNSQTMGGITVAKEPGTKVDFDLKEFFVYNETNNVEGYQPGEDKLVYTIKIFVFTQGEKAEQAHFESQLEPNEAAFFIEDNTGDVSTAKLYAKFGSDVKKQILLDLDDKGKTKSYLKNIPGINDSIIRDLIENGYAEQKISITRQIVTVLCKGIAYAHIVVKGIGWVCDKLGNLIIENLSVPETLWDSHSDSYFLKRENLIDALSISPNLIKDQIAELRSTKSGRVYLSAMPDGFEKLIGIADKSINSFLLNYNDFVKRTIDNLYDTFEENAIESDYIPAISQMFALICGVWNGLVDFIGGIFIFIGFLGQFNYDVYSDIDAFLERYDSFCEAITENFWSDLWEAVTKSYDDMITYLKLKDSDDFNWDKISYITGFTMAFIGTFFIPFADLAKPVEIAAKLEKALVSTELLSKVSKATAKTGKVITGTGKVAAKTVFKLLDNIIAFVAKGRQELIEFFKPVWEEIAQWILKNKRAVESLASKAKSLLSKETKFDGLFRDITKNFIIKNRGILTERQFAKIAKKILENFNIQMHWVDKNSKEFVELFKAWEKEPVFAVFHPSTFKNGRYGVVLEGPAIYFFNGIIRYGIRAGEKIQITAYTLQHELIHLKLWHKMNVEFKELAGLYNKIPNMLHEADVIGTFLKQNKYIKTAKWSMDDILADLKTLNDNIKNYPHWEKAAKKHFGKTEIELKDLENWDLNKHLDKL